MGDLDRVKRDTPNLNILDFVIGGENHGWQTLQKPKMDRQTSGVPIIVRTAGVSVVRELDLHLREMGVSVIVTPFDIDDLAREANACREGLEEAGDRTWPTRKPT